MARSSFRIGGRATSAELRSGAPLMSPPIWQQIAAWHPQCFRDGEQAGGAAAVLSRFVFLDLLMGDADAGGEPPMGEAKLLAPGPNAPSNPNVNGCRGTLRFFLKVHDQFLLTVANSRAVQHPLRNTPSSTALRGRSGLQGDLSGKSSRAKLQGQRSRLLSTQRQDQGMKG